MAVNLPPISVSGISRPLQSKLPSLDDGFWLNADVRLRLLSAKSEPISSQLKGICTKLGGVYETGDKAIRPACTGQHKSKI